MGEPPDQLRATLVTSVGPEARKRAVRRTVLMVGLPSSGKSTYLAALWHTIRTAPGSSEISLEHLPPDLDYLNKLSAQWLACREAVHTSHATSPRTSLSLRGAGEGAFVLNVPDYSGETISDAWVARRWTAAMDQFVSGAVGLLLLVHPDFVHPTVTIEEAQRAADALEAEPPDPDLAAEDFDLASVPTQTILVEFLQLARSRSRRRRLPVGVIISAWDLLVDERLPPTEWLDRRMPLLSQFLSANDDTLPHAVFGVSAQGGIWADEARDQLQLSPDSRPKVVDAAGQDLSDVAAPLRWVLRAS